MIWTKTNTIQRHKTHKSQRQPFAINTNVESFEKKINASSLMLAPLFLFSVHTFSGHSVSYVIRIVSFSPHIPKVDGFVLLVPDICSIHYILKQHCPTALTPVTALVSGKVIYRCLSIEFPQCQSLRHFSTSEASLNIPLQQSCSVGAGCPIPILQKGKTEMEGLTQGHVG